MVQQIDAPGAVSLSSPQAPHAPTCDDFGSGLPLSMPSERRMFKQCWRNRASITHTDAGTRMPRRHTSHDLRVERYDAPICGLRHHMRTRVRLSICFLTSVHGCDSTCRAAWAFLSGDAAKSHNPSKLTGT